jgi:hypothetical protein
MVQTEIRFGIVQRIGIPVSRNRSEPDDGAVFVQEYFPTNETIYGRIENFGADIEVDDFVFYQTDVTGKGQRISKKSAGIYRQHIEKIYELNKYAFLARFPDIPKFLRTFPEHILQGWWNQFPIQEKLLIANPSAVADVIKGLDSSDPIYGYAKDHEVGAAVLQSRSVDQSIKL